MKAVDVVVVRNFLNVKHKNNNSTVSKLYYKYKYNSYFYCAPYSLTDGALQKSANTCFTAVDRLK